MRNAILIFVGLVLSTCTQSLDPQPIFGTNYQPEQIGHFVEYVVRETTFKLNQPSETVSYEIRDMIRNTYQSVGNELTVEVHRYNRKNGRENWNLQNIYVFRKNNFNVIRVENAIPYVRMVFPIRNGKTWNGNSMNDLGLEMYRIEELGKEITIGSNKLNETATVVQRNDSTLVDKNVRYDVYANGIGIVYSRQEKVFYCQNPNAACFGKYIPESGSMVEMKMYNYGKEN